MADWLPIGFPLPGPCSTCVYASVCRPRCVLIDIRTTSLIEQAAFIYIEMLRSVTETELCKHSNWSKLEKPFVRPQHLALYYSKNNAFVCPIGFRPQLSFFLYFSLCGIYWSALCCCHCLRKQKPISLELFLFSYTNCTYMYIYLFFSHTFLLCSCLCGFPNAYTLGRRTTIFGCLF